MLVLVSAPLLEFLLLGPFEVRRDGVALDLGGPRRAALLALLALSPGRPVGVDRLVNDIWGEDPPRTAAHRLQVLASEARKLLPTGAIVHRPAGYVLEVLPDSVDVFEFERELSDGRAALARGQHARAATVLSDALARWRGAALADLAGLDFAEAAARRLEELRTAARELELEARLAGGQASQVIPLLFDLVRDQPLHERRSALLMRALAADGRRAEALAVYAEIRRRLDDELGIQPGPELLDTHRTLVRSETATPRTADPARPGAVIAVGRDADSLAAAVAGGEPVAAASGRELIVICLVHRDASERPDLHTASALARQAATASGVRARSAAFVTHDLAHDVGAFAEEHDASVVILGAGDIVAPARFSSATAALLDQVTAHVAFAFGDTRRPGAGVAALFGGSEHDWAALELAALIARATQTPLRLVGAVTDGGDASRLLARASLAVQYVVDIEVEQALVHPTATELLSAAGERRLLLGVSDRWRSEGLGALRMSLATAAPGGLIVRRGTRPGLLAPADAGTRFSWSIAVTDV
jgi:DNA-binding SARP family transcriptional activator